jgi:hypothetical protein
MNDTFYTFLLSFHTINGFPSNTNKNKRKQLPSVCVLKFYFFNARYFVAYDSVSSWNHEQKKTIRWGFLFITVILSHRNDFYSVKIRFNSSPSQSTASRLMPWKSVPPSEGSVLWGWHTSCNPSPVSLFLLDDLVLTIFLRLWSDHSHVHTNLRTNKRGSVIYFPVPPKNNDFLKHWKVDYISVVQNLVSLHFSCNK